MQDFVDYLVWKHHGNTAQPLTKRSAEARLIDRIQDLDDPTQWVTVIEAGEEVDVDFLHQWLSECGFPVDASQLLIPTKICGNELIHAVGMPIS